MKTVEYTLQDPKASSVEVPAGGVSPLAWTIILALAAAVVVLFKALRKVYSDLRASEQSKAEMEEELLAMLKVMRIEMERSKNRGQ